jgi:hypothetical protein
MPAVRRRAVALLAGMVLSAGLAATAQSIPAMQTNAPSQTGPYAQRNAGFDGAADSDSLAEKRLRMLNAARQKALEADTVKLLNLARELNAEIAAGNGGTLDALQLRKLAEIEKLARSIKEKMSTSVRPAPGFSQIPSPQYR